MRTNPFILKVFGLFFCFATAYSSVDPTAFIKVSKDNNPQCIEYFNYQNELYCTTTAVSAQPVDPAIITWERQKITFDERPWQAVWGKKTDAITTIEYVPAGDNIDQWKELITSQFLPNIPKNVTLQQFTESMVANLRKTGLNPIVKMIETKPDSIIFEFQISEPTNLQQDELQKITLNDKGFYILHYAIKKTDMGETNRSKWLKSLQDSKI